jgi:hypothetical protein
VRGDPVQARACLRQELIQRDSTVHTGERRSRATPRHNAAPSIRIAQAVKFSRVPSNEAQQAGGEVV